MCNSNHNDLHCTKLKIRIYSRKTYTLNFRTIKKRCLSGVVAKPGIATGSRSNKQGFIRERYPWIEGSNVVLQTATEQIPSAPFDLLPCLTVNHSNTKNRLIMETIFCPFNSSEIDSIILDSLQLLCKIQMSSELQVYVFGVTRWQIL